MFLHFPWICLVLWILRSSCNLKEEKKKKKGLCPRDIFRIIYEPHKATRRFPYESCIRGAFFPLYLKLAEEKGDAECLQWYSTLLPPIFPFSRTLSNISASSHLCKMWESVAEWLSCCRAEGGGAYVETVSDLSSLCFQTSYTWQGEGRGIRTHTSVGIELPA